MKELDKIICPGCGAIFNTPDELYNGACPKCTYENGVEPYRLLTISEIMSEERPEDWCSFRLGVFIKSLFEVVDVNVCCECNELLDNEHGNWQETKYGPMCNFCAKEKHNGECMCYASVLCIKCIREGKEL